MFHVPANSTFKLQQNNHNIILLYLEYFSFKYINSTKSELKYF